MRIGAAFLCVAACAWAVDRPATIWRPAHEANFSDRNWDTRAVVDTIVIHTGEGSYWGIISWFQNPNASASSHYVIARNGEITQMVADNDMAWHSTYYNSHSIGIECEGFAGDPDNWTPELMNALADLCAWLCEAYDIRPTHPPGDANTNGGYYGGIGLVGHYQVQTSGSAAAHQYGVRTDPGIYFDWNLFEEMVQSRWNGAPAGPENLRVNAYASGQTASADFAWDPSSGADGYFVDIAQSESDLVNMTGSFQNWDVGANTAVTWTGLAPRTTFFWRVWAYNGAGGNHGYPAGPFTTPGTPPTAPSNLRATARSAGAAAAILFEWDGSDGADGYWIDIATSESDLMNMTGSFQHVNVVGATSFDWTDLPRGTTYVWRVFAYNADGGVHAYADVAVTTPSNGNRLLLGLGRGGNGRVEARTGAWTHDAWLAQGWANYNAANGTMIPACGDLDGDGVEEVVCGLGTYTPAGGWVAIFSGGTYALRRWIHLDWSAYNAANGEIRPAVGDFDGDGRAEIALGIATYTASGGWVYLFDDAAAGHRFLRTPRIPWSAYNSANGSTRPAAGDLDGDGRDELVVGLGSYPGLGGWNAVYDDAAGGYAFRQWVRIDWTAYNTANGDSRPACGNLDADAADEIVLGIGRYASGGGYARIVDDAASSYAKRGWARVTWNAYNTTNGEVRPAIGDVDGDGLAEIVLGLGSSTVEGGYVYVAGDASRNYNRLRWTRSSDSAYNAANGETWPAVGQVR